MLTEQKELNYLKLLENLKDCYTQNIDCLEIPFPCLSDYPIDLPNKLINLGFIVDFKHDCLFIGLKQQKPLLNKP
jgi:hypothetical protein